MPQVINTNVASLNAQRNLNKSQTELSVSLQRLSSGLRINSAKDDAAGLAISERFTTQIRGLNQAARNASDGISLSQTAESALGELTANLQRIRELAVQSANGSNSASDRAALDLEVQQRLAEIDRIATQTTFNGQRVLDGTFGSQQFQVGANVGDTITIDLSTGVRLTQIGRIASSTGSAVDANALASGDVTINGISVGAAVAGTGAQQVVDSAYAKTNAINNSGIADLTATAITGTKASDNASRGVTLTDAADSYSLTVNGVAVFSATGATTVTQATLVSTINSFSTQTGVSAVVNGTAVNLTAADGRNIVVVAAQTESGANGNTVDTGNVAFSAGTTTTRGTIKLQSSAAISVTGTVARIGHSVGSIALDTNTSLSGISVTTITNANTAMQRVDSALTSVSNLRSTFGAIQSRMSSTISNLEAISENLASSRSRILDADFAAETAALTRAQILQQAGIAILAQANALPQNALALLQ